MGYAANIAGQWVRITTSIRIGDVTYTLSAIDSMSPQMRTARGIKTYSPAAPPPPGKRSIGLLLVDDNGSPKEIHQLETIPLAERKAALVAAIDAERDRRQQLDFAYDFGELEAIDDDGLAIPAGGRALQMRFDPDQRNWQALQSQAVVAALAGQGATVMPMRAEDNWNVQTAASDVLAATTAMFVRNAAILFHGGALKSQVRGAASSSALDAIDILAGWPG